jgi:hypothetical protein
MGIQPFLDANAIAVPPATGEPRLHALDRYLLEREETTLILTGHESNHHLA